MKLITTLFLTICNIIALYGQEATTEPDQPTASQIFTIHNSRVYQAATRYNDYGVAKQALYNLLVENPQNDSILYALSLVYAQNNQFASAVLTAKDIISIKPDHTGALEISAMGFEGLGLKDKALENYESLYLKTTNYQILYKMAFLQYDLKKYAECKTNVDILLSKKEADELTASFTIAENQQKEYPLKVAILNLRGLVERDQGNKDAARKTFKEALAIAPDFTLIKNNIAELDK